MIRHDQLAAQRHPGEDPIQVANAAMAGAKTVTMPMVLLPAVTIAENEQIASWLESDRVQPISLEGPDPDLDAVALALRKAIRCAPFGPPDPGPSATP